MIRWLSRRWHQRQAQRLAATLAPELRDLGFALDGQSWTARFGDQHGVVQRFITGVLAFYAEHGGPNSLEFTTMARAGAAYGDPIIITFQRARGLTPAQQRQIAEERAEGAEGAWRLAEAEAQRHAARCSTAERALERVTHQRDALIATLAFYAAARTYEPGEDLPTGDLAYAPAPIDTDRGATARAGLEAIRDLAA